MKENNTKKSEYVNIKSPVQASNVTGMILAGGKGKRLMPLTNTIPKPLLEIKDGYCIMDKQLNDMKNVGISTVVILIGHLGEKIKKRYGESWNGIKIEYSDDGKEELGTWGSIKKAVETKGLKGKALIMNSDIVTNIPLSEIMRDNQHSVIILGVPMRSKYGIIDINGNTVIGFKEKPLLPYFINGGIYFVNDLSDLMRYGEGLQKTQNSIEYDIFPKIAKESKLGMYKVQDMASMTWNAIDSIKDLEEVRNMYNNNPNKPENNLQTKLSNQKV